MKKFFSEDLYLIPNNKFIISSISFALGVLTFFSLKTDPDKLFIILLTFFSFTLMINKFMRIFVITFLIGFFISLFKSSLISSYSIDVEIKNAKINAQVEYVKTTNYGKQILLNDVSINKKHVPFKIRVYTTQKVRKNLTKGSKIFFKSNLKPPMKSVVPSGYNFLFKAYFSNIGATGRILGKIKILDNNNISKYSIINVRHEIIRILNKNLGFKNASLASGIFLGETSSVPKKTLENIRYSGISHIMCVSGLHLSIVAMFFYMNSRILLNFSDYIAHNYNIKIISAFIGIFFSFIYLLITGFQVAAVRAFIMTSIILFSIIISREPHPMRSLSLACFIILSIWPEQIIQPSFQLSFVAVISLLKAFEFIMKNEDYKHKNFGVLSKLKLYFQANFYSSLIAGLSTAPIVAYHFYIFSSYTIFTNLLTLPLVSFIVMPFGIISFFLYPLNLSTPTFYILKQALIFIEFFARFFASLPLSAIQTGYISNLTIALYVIGFLLLVIFKDKIRSIGFCIIMLSFINYNFQQRPEFLVNFDDKFIVTYINKDLELYGKVNFFTQKIILSWYGLENLNIKDIREFESDKLNINFRMNEINYKDNKHNIDSIAVINNDIVLDYSVSRFIPNRFSIKEDY